jgi:hypothetical protein
MEEGYAVIRSVKTVDHTTNDNWFVNGISSFRGEEPARLY